MAFGIASGLIWFGVFLLIHFAVFHARHIENCFSVIMRILVACIAGHLATVGLTHAADLTEPLVRGAALLYGLLTMAALYILYMPFFYNVVNSLSIQTLVLLSRTEQGRLPLAVLHERFGSRAIVTNRLQTMVINGYLSVDNGAYRLTEKGESMVRIFGGLKEFWRMGAGG